MKSTFLTYSHTLTIIALWCSAIIITPIIASLDFFFGKILYQFFSHICHQIDERSFHIFSHKFPVCIRCTSIYFGFLFGGIFIHYLKKILQIFSSYLLLLISITPILIDVFLSFFHIHQSTMITKIITGGWFGIIVSVLLVPLIQKTINHFSQIFIHFIQKIYATKTR